MKQNKFKIYPKIFIIKLIINSRKLIWKMVLFMKEKNRIFYYPQLINNLSLDTIFQKVWITRGHNQKVSIVHLLKTYISHKNLQLIKQLTNLFYLKEDNQNLLKFEVTHKMMK